MSDPEILDPEPAGTAGTQTSGGIERLVSAVQRALPGRTVRVHVEPYDATKPRLPFMGPRFRIEAEGKGGTLVVESGALFVVQVAFGTARFTVDGGAHGPGPDVVVEKIVERVRAFAHDELVVLEEQKAPRLLRTTVLRVADGRFVEVVDNDLVPQEGTEGDVRFISFNNTFSGRPSTQQRAQLDKLAGGLFGKLKRKLAEKVFAKATEAIAATMNKAAGGSRSAGDDDDDDDGRRKLGKR